MSNSRHGKNVLEKNQGAQEFEKQVFALLLVEDRLTGHVPVW